MSKAFVAIWLAVFAAGCGDAPDYAEAAKAEVARQMPDSAAVTFRNVKGTIGEASGQKVRMACGEFSIPVSHVPEPVFYRFYAADLMSWEGERPKVTLLWPPRYQTFTMAQALEVMPDEDMLYRYCQGLPAR